MATLALVAGSGRFPAELAAAARRAGWRVVAIGLVGLADAGLAAHVDALEWAHVAEFGRLFDTLRGAGAEDVVLAGKVPKTFLWEHPELVKPDARALAAFAALRDRKDDSLLGAVVQIIEAEGLRVRTQLELAPDLCAPAGVFGATRPSAEQAEDVAFGWPVAKAIGALDVGQSVVIQRKAVLALEAVEGTDRAIERGAELAERGRGIVVVKVAKPSQDLRFDVPTIGLATLRTLVKGGGGAIAIEAGLTLVLERAALVAEADAAGVALLGVDARWLAEHA